MEIIRPVADTDNAGILRINAACRPAVAPLDGTELARLLSLADTHRVATAGAGALMAYILVFARDDAYHGEEFQYFKARLRQPFLYVDQLAVESERRRSGIGRRMYRAVLEQARARNIKRLCCEVNSTPPNPGSLQFHRQLGFTALHNGDTLDGRQVSFLVRDV